MSILPCPTRARVFQACATTAANAKADIIPIGGAFEDQVLFMENQIAKLALGLDMSSNERFDTWHHDFS